jgi:hypothetical protein
MTTERDLRIKFHMDTASLPFWDPDQWRVKIWDETDYPTSEYGQWLEEKAGGHSLQRDYQFENHIAPTYTSKCKSWYKRGWNKYYNWVIRTVYDPSYIFWLEEKIIKILNRENN